MQRFRALLAVTAIGPLAAGAASLPAQGTPSRDSAVTATVRPAPWVTRRDLAVLGIGAGLAFIAQRADLTVRDELRRDGWQRNDGLEVLERIGDEWGGALALVTGFALWGQGAVAHDRPLATVGFRAVEAITVSGLVTKALKIGIGRARPRVDSTDAWNVEWMRGTSNDHESMPSGHATAAFAFAAAVTSEVARRSPRRVRLVGATTFTLAGVTAWSRMHANAHWLSDVTMGAAVGLASGWAVTRWHATRPGNWLDRTLLPVDGASVAVAPLYARGQRGGTRIGVRLTWR